MQKPHEESAMKKKLKQVGSITSTKRVQHDTVVCLLQEKGGNMSC